jgi:RNA 2',3'-cyclic 3'-phosphodiesterase
VSYRPKLFTGIELDEPVRSWCAAISARLQTVAFPGRFELPEKFHITLAFLGWVDAERVEEIRKVMRDAAAHAAAFTITLDRVGAFPHERRPRVVWIGSHDQGTHFRTLSERLQTGYSEIGFRFDKPAVAHVTIARVREARAHLPMLDVEPIRLLVEHVTLFESIPAGHTTRYEVRDRALLTCT